jgi:hypothetical protein
MANSVWVHAACGEIVSEPEGLVVSREDTGLTLNGSGITVGGSIWGTGHVTVRFCIPLTQIGTPQNHLQSVRLRFVSSPWAGIKQVTLHDGSDVRLFWILTPPMSGDHSAVGGLAWDSEDKPACTSGLVFSVVVEMKRYIVSHPMQLITARRELIAKARESLAEEDQQALSEALDEAEKVAGEKGFVAALPLDLLFEPVITLIAAGVDFA